MPAISYIVLKKSKANTRDCSFDFNPSWYFLSTFDGSNIKSEGKNTIKYYYYKNIITFSIKILTSINTSDLSQG